MKGINWWTLEVARSVHLKMYDFYFTVEFEYMDVDDENLTKLIKIHKKICCIFGLY